MRGENEERTTSKSVQVTLKVPEDFLKRFEEVSEKLGYSRNEAIREAMRRFEEQASQKLMNRPENAAQIIRQIMESIITPILSAAEAFQRKEDQKKLELPKISREQPP
jgi:metal-responsive CopG/Arc/MetJ family transcriptional regulator